MKRRKQLRRGKWARKLPKPKSKKRAASKYKQRERFVPYMLAVKSLPCAAIIVEGHICDGEVQADHAGPRGMGQKAHDATCIPMCELAHQQRDAFHGPFKTWDHDKMRLFLFSRIQQTQRYLHARGIAIPKMEPEEFVALMRWGGAAIANRAAPTPLTEDIRDVGNVDVRHPDAAPLPAARAVPEGAKP